MHQLPAAFKALTAYDQFIIWDKRNKKPIDPNTGRPCDHLTPTAWMNAKIAITWTQRIPGYGAGFVFTRDDPFWFKDLDKCFKNGAWSEHAVMICNALSGCAIEVSQSGTGLHIIGTGVAPPHGCKNLIFGTEFYTEGRYAALTGIHAIGDAGHNPGPQVLNWLVANYFPQKVSNKQQFNWTDKSIEGYNGPTNDETLIKRMLASKSGTAIFGGKASIQALWAANPAALGQTYPDIGGRAFDWSSADAALCSHLAFWTGKNCSRIDRIFRLSALNREKWKDREDYRYRTIEHAVSNCKKVYSKTKPTTPVAQITDTGTTQPTDDEPRYKTGLQLMSIEQQVKFFKGCVYVANSHNVFLPNGTFAKPSAFKVIYGGYIFSLDLLNDKNTTNAFEAFTESQGVAHKKADLAVFRPLDPSGQVFEHEGLKLLNTYVPIETKRVKGNPAPFFDLIYKLFPIKHDRDIVLSYMVACVQFPGVKFQWCLLIQGMEGNGKSFLSTAVSHAIGIRYTHKPMARNISNHFNAWIVGKLFVNIEEIYVSNNQEKIDALKPIITDSRIPVTPKGIDQVTGDNFANLICNTNYKDGIRKTRTDRRWCVFYTPQQNPGDLERDKLGDTYFPNLFKWANYQDGWAIITDFLKSYVIPDELNPKNVPQAPVTSSTEQAFYESMGREEQEIIEATKEGRPGFNGGWISSMALTRLLKELNIKMPQNKRITMLHELGYEPHPGLRDGRVNNFISIDRGRPRLYIKTGSLYCNLKTQSEIIQHYVDCQSQMMEAKAKETFVKN